MNVCGEMYLEMRGQEETAHLMDDGTGTPRLLSMEEKWQIIFNEKTRAPIYAVTQYIEYLNQFVNGQNAASRDNDDVIRRDSINPISYLLRKLKLDLKMSYESFLEEFIKPEMGGLGLLVRLLKSIQNAGARQSGSTNMAQLKHYKKTMTDEHDCLLCIKYSLRPKGSLSALLAVNYGLETVASSLLSTYTKSRGTAVEILTVAMSAVDGFSKVLDCFTYIQLKIGEPVRFKSLVNMMNMNSPQNVIFKVCGLKFVNTLLAAASNTNIRVFLQHELQNAGLDVPDMLQNTSGTGLEYDDLRHELEEWQRTFVDVDALIHQGPPRVFPDIANINPKLVDDLQNQVKSLTEEKSLLERKLRAVSGELKRRHEELRRRSMSGCDAFTQTYGPQEADRESIGCQCGSNISSSSEDKRKTTAKYFGWKDVYISQNEDTTYYPSKQRSGADGRGEEKDADEADDADDDIPPTPDEQGLVKVKQWLKCHCSSSEILDGHRDMNGESEDQGHSNGLYFKRNSFTRKNVKKADFPGNWKIIPKSIEQFPARFSSNKCHKSNCDRCEMKIPSKNINNLDQGQPEVVIHQASVELRLQELVTNKKRSDVRSQSSDSAIGGSGERLWNDRQITLLPPETSEAEILQELIQPDDSASGVPENEPYPDYSTVPNSPRNQESFMTELSSVLREFEGNLTRYELPATVVKNVTSPQTSVETYVTLGDV
ncbi:uncharacterized protein LOC128246425 isoform X2 [Mya arenaria]|uniref:uncharacterized protein LOC128246425 isoform X2 n=1 Tax=Mya arenaria TaxID=6604 RepID=UPI0022E92906|nr:uncharacterized protein LOC128246425 isoform X2 [Mya arenaria]